MEKLQRFMYGRYGGDSFSIFLLIFGFVVSIVSSFIWPYLAILSYLLYFYVIFRAFSRNIPARKKEYYAFMRVCNPVHSWCSFQKRRFNDRKEYKYFRCPNCKQRLRAPKKKGKIMVTCQKCHKEFSTRT